MSSYLYLNLFFLAANKPIPVTDNTAPADNMGTHPPVLPPSAMHAQNIPTPIGIKPIPKHQPPAFLVEDSLRYKYSYLVLDIILYFSDSLIFRFTSGLSRVGFFSISYVYFLSPVFLSEREISSVLFFVVLSSV